MKIRRLISSLATGVLATSILVACSSNKQADNEVSETKTSQTTEMTSKEEVASFDPSEYLTIDTSKLNDYKVSDMVIDVAGTYSGVVANNWSTTEYQVRINEDGTYMILSRGLFLRDENTIFEKADPRPYLDSKNTVQYKQLETTINDKLYEFSDFNLERGVVIEKYSQLYFAPLDSHKIFPYLDQNGELDLSKGILVDGNSLGMNDRVVDTTSDYQKFLETNFNYSKTLTQPSEFFVIDSRKLTIDNVEVPKSSDVDSFLKTDLTKSLDSEKVLKQIESSNDVLQFARSKVPIDTYTITALTDFSDVYLSDGQKVEAEYAITLKDEKHTMSIYDETEIYAYYNGTIYYGKEQNGKFILDSAI